LAGRYPSSPSQDRDSQWPMTKDSPLTVAGAAAELGKFPCTAFPFDPQTGTVGKYGRSLSKSESIPPWAPAILTGRVRYFCRMSSGARTHVPVRAKPFEDDR